MFIKLWKSILFWLWLVTFLFWSWLRYTIKPVAYVTWLVSILMLPLFVEYTRIPQYWMSSAQRSRDIYPHILNSHQRIEQLWWTGFLRKRFAILSGFLKKKNGMLQKIQSQKKALIIGRVHFTKDRMLWQVIWCNLLFRTILFCFPSIFENCALLLIRAYDGS